MKCCLDGYFLEGEPSTPRTDIPYSPSAYPLLILQTLKETPQTRKEIIQAIQMNFGVKIDRKAADRHLELLNALGFNLHQKPDSGYFVIGNSER